MRTVNLHEAKTQLSRLVDQAVGGEEIVIAKAGTPLVRLVPVAALKGPRKLGALAGQVHEATDCWDPDPGIANLFPGASGDAPPAQRAAVPSPRGRKR
jgi:prevent-host-death family protein